MDGFTVVLIDSSDPSEGDFVYVESFESAKTLVDSLAAEPIESYSSPLGRALMRAAKEIEERNLVNG